jgi:hypothetical protein
MPHTLCKADVAGILVPALLMRLPAMLAGGAIGDV